MFWILIGCALVTIIPRILPFIFVRKLELPESFLKWLSYIPICILTALVMDELLMESEHGSIRLDFTAFFAGIPTLFVAIWTKSLSYTVITGVVAMALIRIFF
ncbi:branched-subunit amino acid transport protein [Alkalicoccobacillus murimartini]|uniref:Branched-subunit amino acid transport protein n=2 Tax=Alkalicoccobacillus murimartini TaxID=171685 RepID=A0ABT9YCY3_9BACI|nr:branched-subunit amino acid transport protein [Alkalicoccobacillus murimartini]